MKNKIIILLIVLISGCSSIPKVAENISLDSLIQKPELNYKTNSLPKVINLYFHKIEGSPKLPDEVGGFLENLFFYKNKINYKPKIILTPLDSRNCINQKEVSSLKIVFDIGLTGEGFKSTSWLQILSKSKTLYVSNKDIGALNFENRFLISRKKERDNLIDYISSNTNIVVIDSIETLDASIINEYMLSQGKRVSEQRTYTNNVSSQSMFSDLLMVNRSKERLRKLSRRLSIAIAGEPRTRNDIKSFIFSVGLDDARSLKPALDYLADIEMEVFILNSWRTNTFYKSSDKDLSGTINSDIPFMMPIIIPEFLKNSKRTREFAIGYDAFEVMMLKYGNVNSRQFKYKGLTGKIDVSSKEVEREPYVFKITEEGLKLL